MKRFASAFLLMMALVLGMAFSAQASQIGSSDATLASLVVQPGVLTPEFDPSVREYSVNVGSDVEKLLVSAQTTDNGAKMVVVGNSGLSMGVNEVYVNVTAADSISSARYVIYVNRGGQAEETTAAETTETEADTTQAETEAQTQAGGNSLLPGMIITETPAETAAPAEQDTTQAETAPAAAGSEIAFGGLTLTVSTPAENMVPREYTPVSLEIGGQTVTGYAFPSRMEIEDAYLIYGTEGDGTTGYYLYDLRTGTAAPAPEGIVSANEESSIYIKSVQEVTENFQKQLRNRMMIIIGLAALSMILLIALTASLTRGKHEEEVFEEDLPENEGDYEEDEYPDDLEDLEDMDQEELPAESPQELSQVTAPVPEIEDPLDEPIDEDYFDEDLEELPLESSIPALAEDDLAELFKELPEEEPEISEPEPFHEAVIFNPTAEKESTTVTVDEGNEELDEDFDLLDAILNNSPEAVREKQEKRKEGPTETASLEDDEDFEFFDL